jgi:hypothetical protein
MKDKGQRTRDGRTEEQMTETVE